MGSSKSAVKNKRRVWADEHGHGAGSSGRPGIAGRVDGDIGTYCDGVPPVPVGRFDPTDNDINDACHFQQVMHVSTSKHLGGRNC